MTTTSASQRLAYMRGQFELRDTADLLAIWQEHDEKAWTAEAFDVLQDILRERLGSVPAQAQNPPEPLALHVLADGALQWAWKYEEAGEYERALDACEAALRLDPNLAEAHFLRGLLYDERRDYVKAIDAYEQALRLNPQMTEAQESLRAAEAEWADLGPAAEDLDEPEAP